MCSMGNFRILVYGYKDVFYVKLNEGDGYSCINCEEESSML